MMLSAWTTCPGEFTMLELAKKELDWEPTIALEEGLEKTIAYFRKRLV